MVRFNTLRSTEKKKIQMACANLFSPEEAQDHGFLMGLNLAKVKQAHRKIVKGIHPDLFRDESQEIISRQTKHFIDVSNSYQFLTSFFKEESLPLSGNKSRKRKIIAVGGAKGGIGKSTFSANLGVFLSSRGYKTVAVDLDLGGANLHLFLGERYVLRRTINDFLNKKSATLQEVMTKSRYGPYIIGGDSSEFGISNINFAKKLKLLRAIQNLDADYVILDLGGDISFNTLDFFLAADHGIVITTSDCPAYIGAYHLIKAALYRKLSRLFGPESSYNFKGDNNLEEFIKDSVKSSTGFNSFKDIEELLERVKEKQFINSPLITKAISDYNPYLIVNNVSDEQEAFRVTKTLQKISKGKLSVELTCLGCISHQREIGASINKFVPVVSAHSKGRLAWEINNITGRLFEHN